MEASEASSVPIRNVLLKSMFLSFSVGLLFCFILFGLKLFFSNFLMASLFSSIFITTLMMVLYMDSVFEVLILHRHVINEKVSDYSKMSQFARLAIEHMNQDDFRNFVVATLNSFSCDSYHEFSKDFIKIACFGSKDFMKIFHEEISKKINEIECAEIAYFNLDVSDLRKRKNSNLTNEISALRGLSDEIRRLQKNSNFDY